MGAASALVGHRASLPVRRSIIGHVVGADDGVLQLAAIDFVLLGLDIPIDDAAGRHAISLVAAPVHVGLLALCRVTSLWRAWRGGGLIWGNEPRFNAHAFPAPPGLFSLALRAWRAGPGQPYGALAAKLANASACTRFLGKFLFPIKHESYDPPSDKNGVPRGKAAPNDENGETQGKKIEEARGKGACPREKLLERR